MNGELSRRQNLVEREVSRIVADTRGPDPAIYGV
jgi:hypothetical protein